MDLTKHTSTLVSWLLVSSLALPAAAQEGAPPVAEKSKPVTQKADIEVLIEQLGDPSYRVRGAAEDALRELGADAVEALEKAAGDHADSEVQWRARRLVGQIESGKDSGLRARRPGDRSAAPGVRDRQPPDLGGVFDDLFRRLERDFEVDVPRHRFFQDDFFCDLDDQMNEMRRRMRAFDARGFDHFGAGTGQSFEMRVGPDGVAVKVIEKDEKGELETKTYEAPDLETFRENYPDVAKRYMDGGSRGFRLQLDPDLRGLRTPGLLRVMPGMRGLGLQGLESDGPRLGVYVAELDAEALEELGVEADKGLQVQSVVPGSLAERLGVEAEDIVVEIEGQAVGTAGDVSEALREAGDQVKVKVHRGDETKVLEAKVGGEGEELKPRGLRRRAR